MQQLRYLRVGIFRLAVHDYAASRNAEVNLSRGGELDAHPVCIGTDTFMFPVVLFVIWFSWLRCYGRVLSVFFVLG